MNAPGPAILVVEDDRNLRTTLRDNLEHGGYRVEEAGSVAEARAQMKANVFALILLDVMLPDGDGYTYCRELRMEDVKTPVMMLTARSLEEDLVRGFESGAQDYLSKPYRLGELMARVKALVNRGGGGGGGGGGAPAKVLEFAGYAVDLERREVKKPEGSVVELTTKEFDLLVFLIRNKERALTRDEILNNVWGYRSVDTHTVDNFVSSLKKKLGWTDKSRFIIKSVRGVGYRMVLDG